MHSRVFYVYAIINIVIALILGMVIGRFVFHSGPPPMAGMMMFQGGMPPPPPPGGMPQGPQFEMVKRHFVDALQLSDAQIKQVDVIMKKHQPKMEATMGKLRVELRSDMDEIDRDISSVLTPEQKLIFKKMKREMPN
jgi:Spy/CpxP family protein refolding chaperone